MMKKCFAQRMRMSTASRWCAWADWTNVAGREDFSLIASPRLLLAVCFIGHQPVAHSFVGVAVDFDVPAASTDAKCQLGVIERSLA